ncbi:MAG TPA: LegC family aminotransferase [Gammaproteobacteria bacterium]|nr:LegC family aminotransferase [Gammaproteobacteria bacterium]
MVHARGESALLQSGSLQHLTPEATLAPVLSALNAVLGSTRPVALHQPHFAGREWEYVKDCLDTGWVSSVGAYVTRLETDLQNYTGIANAVAVVNGTAALHVCCLLAGVSAGDEVLLPTLTFVATANAVSYCGATPHMVDVSATTLGVDAGKLAAYLTEIAELRGDTCYNRITGQPIRALIVMHAFGHPVELDALAEVCQRYRIALIEDAAEALGSFYHGKHVGHWGILSAISFNGNKIVTTGGGGAILTNDAELARRARHLTTTAKQAHPWAFIHDQVAYNYRLPNLNAAVGCAQLEQLPDFVSRKRELATRYQQTFNAVEIGRIVREPHDTCSNYWLNLLQLHDGHGHLRDTLLETCQTQGILVRPAWELMHRLPMYQHCPRMDLSRAEHLERHLICLPSSVELGSVELGNIETGSPHV